MVMPCDIIIWDAEMGSGGAGWLGIPRGWLGSCDSCDPPGGPPGVPMTRMRLIALLMPPGVLKLSTARDLSRRPTCELF